jgi:molybdate transport system permease protein
MIVSLKVSCWALLVSWPWAILFAWILATQEFRGQSLLLSVMMLPAVIPPLVMGYLLLLVLSPQGGVGQHLASWGVKVPLTQKGAILAAMVVGWPYLLANARQAFLQLDRRLIDAAANLGASPLRRLIAVAIPMVLPGILTGGLLALARGLGEFGATLVLAGSIPGETQTMTLLIYQLMESPHREDEAFVLVGCLLLLVAFILITVEYLGRRGPQKEH